MTGWLIFGLLLVLAVAIAAVLGQHRALRLARSERDAALDTGESNRQRLRGCAEQLRIARELHDVVAHNLSLINVQSGVALQQVEKNSAKAAGTVATIKSTSRNALEDVQALRQAIQSAQSDPPFGQDTDTGDSADSGSAEGKPGRRDSSARRDRVTPPDNGRLRRRLAGSTPPAGPTADENRHHRPPPTPAPAAREPEPTMADLDALLRRPGLTGLTVRIRTLGTAGPLPKAIDDTAVQIIEESLNNVVRHAAGAEATVTVRYTPDSVDLTVDNTRPTGKAESTGPTRGMGIITMRERTHALGGALTAGPKPSGGYRVAARLPSRPLHVATDPDPGPRTRKSSSENGSRPPAPQDPVETGPGTKE